MFDNFLFKIIFMFAEKLSLVQVRKFEPTIENGLIDKIGGRFEVEEY
jgi:hypothetical protein